MKFATFVVSTTLTLAASVASAQPPGITPEMINRSLPLDGAPLAIAGPYAAVTNETAFGSPNHFVFRPSDLKAFPKSDTLPVLVWGNGGCAQDSKSFANLLNNVASHGFLVVTTAAVAGEARRQATVADLTAAIDWAIKENTRETSPLRDKIDTAHIAVMGVSCGGFLATGTGADPRIGTVGVFNSGVSAPAANGAATPFPTTDALAKLHTPMLYLNGGEPDFMMAQSRANYDAIAKLPAFYGSRHNAGHSATYPHPGGGEFANVVSNWLKFQFKGDKVAGKMFTGKDCTLCKDKNWDVASKNL